MTTVYCHDTVMHVVYHLKSLKTFYLKQTAQVCAYELGVPMSLIRIKKQSSTSNANTAITGGSIGSELNCMVINIFWVLVNLLEVTYFFRIKLDIWS